MAMTKTSPQVTARREPFGLLRQMTSELDRVFDEPVFASFHWPSRAFGTRQPTWSPDIDVFEKDNCLVTRIDLPGMKKEEVTVEVTDGHLAISGERTTVKEEKKNNDIPFRTRLRPLLPGRAATTGREARRGESHVR